MDYYWENANYAAWGGQNWATGREAWNNAIAGDAIGFAGFAPSGLVQHTDQCIYFNLDANEAGPNQPLRLTLDLFALKANTTHDLDVRLNGETVPFATRAGICWIKTG